MKRYSITELQNTLMTYGRTFRDPKEDILYFNWSASTVELTFRGTHLNVSFRADCGYEFEGMPGDANAPKRATWPWVAVFLDDMTTPVRKFQVSSPNESWLVYQSMIPETHKIRITKLTENSKTFLGIAAFTAEGDFLPTEKPAKKRIEFVGDSITCGYGNLVKDDASRHFYSCDEDAWVAYGPTAARKLNMECSLVSISGITAVKHPGWMLPPMDELYSYTDKVFMDKLGMKAEKWDFKNNRNDYVVVNLGTNDCFGILFSNDDEELEKFPRQYAAFLKQVREANGPDTKIICALGTMNYYLYSDILDAVKQYREETDDQNFYTLRMKPILPFDGLGADGHPYIATHKKMADEVAAFIKGLE